MDRDHVIKTISVHRPDWHVGAIEYLGQGDFCTAYLVDRQWVCRFARHHDAAASLGREACLLPRIAQRFDLRVPDLQHIEADPPFTAHPLLPGPALTRDRYGALPEAARERCAVQLAIFVHQLHDTDINIPRSCGIPEIDYRRLFGALTPRADRQLYHRIDSAGRRYVETTVGAFVDAEPARSAPVLLHGDLSPDHVLFDPQANTLTGIIDFGDASLGDPAWDLVVVYEDYGLDFLGRFMGHYTSSDRAPLLERMFRLWVLAAIEWAVLSAEEDSNDLSPAIDQLRRLRVDESQLLDEVLETCAR
jgi:aminoglycoside 2''-phosphotransferase